MSCMHRHPDSQNSQQLDTSKGEITCLNVRFWPKAVIRRIPGGHGLLPLYWPDGVGQQLNLNHTNR